MKKKYCEPSFNSFYSMFHAQRIYNLKIMADQTN